MAAEPLTETVWQRQRRLGVRHAHLRRLIRAGIIKVPSSKAAARAELEQLTAGKPVQRLRDSGGVAGDRAVASDDC